ncbi:MAG: TetR/AcrR family transcriptional regulator, partial [Frankia sp.]|nr:TetR/AcrR family transcriptional regulator [Frankia sp.]
MLPREGGGTLPRDDAASASAAAAPAGPRARSRAGSSAGAAAGRRERTGRRPRGRQEVREALLDAAQRLIARQGPANVRLREIADEARVNFGLVYQYLGTREELLHAVYQRVAARSATRFEGIDALGDVIDLFLAVPDDSIGRIMGWAALEGGYSADVFGPSPAQERIVSIIQQEAAANGRPMPAEEARILAAFLQVVALGWRLFRSIGMTTANVPAHAAADADRYVAGWLHQLTELVLRPGAPAEESRPGAPGQHSRAA